MDTGFAQPVEGAKLPIRKILLQLKHLWDLVSLFTFLLPTDGLNSTHSNSQSFLPRAITTNLNTLKQLRNYFIVYGIFIKVRTYCILLIYLQVKMHSFNADSIHFKKF